MSTDNNNHDKKEQLKLDGLNKIFGRIEDKETPDWYKWWFSESRKKKILGVILVTFIMLPLIFANLIILWNLIIKTPYVTQDEVLGLDF